MVALLLAKTVLMLLAFRQVQPPTPPPLPMRVYGEIVQNGQGVIEGQVTRFNTEEPISEVQVTLTGGPSTSPSATVGQLRTNTDSNGRFAFRSLPTGRYVVSVHREGYFRRSLRASDPEIVVGPGQSVSRLALWLVPGGTISGRILDSRGRPAAGASIKASRLSYVDGKPELTPVKETSSDDRGDYRLWGLEPGEYFVFGEKESADGVARSYYPGGSDGRAALNVAVAPGIESAKIDFALATAASTVNVSGVVTIAVPGFESNIVQQFYLVPMEPDRLYEKPIAFANAVSNVQDRAAGKFELRNVRSGAYELYALFQDRSGSTTKYYVARTAIDVGLEDLGGIALVLRSGIDLTGTVRYGSAVARPATPLRIQLRPKVVLPTWPTSSLSGTVSADGTFSIPNVPELQYAISVSPVGSNSYVADIVQGRSSILDRGILIVDRRLPDTLEVSVQSPPATVSGTVAALPQQLAAGVTITLVPEDDRRENFTLYKRTLATSSGSFSFMDITPGRYKLFAWESIPNGAELSREFMEPYKDDATEIVAASGNTSSVGLRLTSK